MNIRQLSIFFLMLLVAVSPVFVLAQSYNPNTLYSNQGLVPCDGVSINGQGTECKCEHLTTLANRVLTFLIYIMIFISALTFSYAGFQYLTAGGDTGKVTRASTMLKNVAKGLTVALIAWLLVDTLAKTLMRKEIYDVWSQICS